MLHLRCSNGFYTPLHELSYFIFMLTGKFKRALELKIAFMQKLLDSTFTLMIPAATLNLHEGIWLEISRGNTYMTHTIYVKTIQLNANSHWTKLHSLTRPSFCRSHMSSYGLLLLWLILCSCMVKKL